MSARTIFCAWPLIIAAHPVLSADHAVRYKEGFTYEIDSAQLNLSLTHEGPADSQVFFPEYLEFAGLPFDALDCLIRQNLRACTVDIRRLMIQCTTTIFKDLHAVVRKATRFMQW